MSIEGTLVHVISAGVLRRLGLRSRRARPAPVVTVTLPMWPISKLVSRPRKKTQTPLTAKQMRCRAKGCKARSKGPRFRYLCDKHKER